MKEIVRRSQDYKLNKILKAEEVVEVIWVTPNLKQQKRLSYDKHTQIFLIIFINLLSISYFLVTMYIFFSAKK